MFYTFGSASLSCGTCVLQKVLIPLVSTMLFYICTEATIADKLHGIVGISALVFVVAFFVAKMFTEVIKQTRQVGSPITITNA